MCYICEDNGTVGKRYKAAMREINAALKVWRRKKCGPECYATCRGGGPRTGAGSGTLHLSTG